MTAVVNGIFIALSYPAYTDTPAPIIHDDVSDISSDNNISDISEESDTTTADSDSTTSAHADSDITDSDDSAADAAMDDADDEADYSNAEPDSDEDCSSSSDVDFSDNAIDSDADCADDAEHADDERDVCHWTVFTENLVRSPERVRDWLLSMKKSRPGTFTKFATLLATRLHDKYPHKAMFVELLY